METFNKLISHSYTHERNAVTKVCVFTQKLFICLGKCLSLHGNRLCNNFSHFLCDIGRIWNKRSNTDLKALYLISRRRHYLSHSFHQNLLLQNISHIILCLGHGASDSVRVMCRIVSQKVSCYQYTKISKETHLILCAYTDVYADK